MRYSFGGEVNAVSGSDLGMEPFHGRRGGKDPSGAGMLCGIHRATQTSLLMVAMVATMAVVLVWEASPLVISGRAQSPVIAGTHLGPLSPRLCVLEDLRFRGYSLSVCAAVPSSPFEENAPFSKSSSTNEGTLLLLTESAGMW